MKPKLPNRQPFYRRLPFLITVGIAIIVAVSSFYGGNNSRSTDAVATDAPRVESAQQVENDGLVAEGKPVNKVLATVNGNLDIIVGKKYHVEEAMTDDESARTLSLARSVGNRNGIEAMYGDPAYLHYGGTNEEPRPTCTVEDQDPVDVDKTGLNAENIRLPIKCKLEDGSDLFVTAFEP